MRPKHIPRTKCDTAHTSVVRCAHIHRANASRSRRLVSPVVLRQYLLWLSDSSRASWQGYVLALALGGCGLCVAIIQHQQPWCGCCVDCDEAHGRTFCRLAADCFRACPVRRYGTLLGWLMRQQAILAVYQKLLALNATAVSAISPGLIINLVSNDVRRFDDGECCPSNHLTNAPLAAHTDGAIPLPVLCTQSLLTFTTHSCWLTTPSATLHSLLLLAVRVGGALRAHPGVHHGVTGAGRCGCGCWHGRNCGAHPAAGNAGAAGGRHPARHRWLHRPTCQAHQ